LHPPTWTRYVAPVVVLKLIREVRSVALTSSLQTPTLSANVGVAAVL
jgi:hypothetical protein